MTVRVAFIGAGGIADWQHFDNLEEMDNVDVVAICDVDAETAKAAADRFDVESFTDHHDLYEQADFDAVFVCLPPFAHDDQEIMAAERGIDIFVEKPLALSNEKAHEIQDAIETNGVIAQAGYNWRYSAGLERASEILDGRTLGYIEGYWWGGAPGGPDHWWRRMETCGGQTVEQTTHIFDAIRFLAGGVECVSAVGVNRLETGVDFSDATSATMEHESGLVSHVSTSCASESSKFGIEIVADGATLTVRQHDISGTVDGEEIDEKFDQNPYVEEVEAFVEAVETRDPASIRSPYADATKSLALTLAVNESIDSGEPTVPEDI